MFSFKEIQSASNRVYSQCGQDGIIQFLFDKIGTTNKVCVEFGFNSLDLIGGSGANCAKLVLHDGWNGIFFDQTNENLSINLHKVELTSDNIGDIFRQYKVPENPDYVSIDVDSIDLWLMDGILKSEFRPRVISVEYNINFPLNFSVTVLPDTRWNNDMVYGASLRALDILAKQHGYILVAVEYGGDAFFVDKNILPVGFKSCIDDCKNLTEFNAHNPAYIARIFSQIVYYPSLHPLTMYTILSMPTVFRIKNI